MSLQAMSKSLKRIIKLANSDGRYRWEAFVFLQEALVYAQLELGLGRPRPYGTEGDEPEPNADSEPSEEAHLTGQELCQAIRMYAADRYGLMAKVVLNSWNVKTTRDFGEIVYKLIELGEMTKSLNDRLEDFDDVYDFGEALQKQYEITMSDES
jgi:uncharacterized repeat protein (TIGR04138 family)